MIPAAILRVLVQADGVAKAVAGLSQVEAAGRKAGASADTTSKKFAGGSKAIVSAAKVGGLAVAGLGAASVKMAGDYESSMNTLQAVSGATGRQMDKLSKLAVKLGADVKLPGTSAQDAAEAMTEMIKAGVSMKDTMEGVRGVLVLSAAAGVSNARAAEIASNALNTFGLKGKQVNKVVDTLANTANASSVEIEDVADAMQMAGSVFSSFQGPVVGAEGAMKDLSTAIGLLGNAGIKGSDAGTSLKQMLLSLAKPALGTSVAMRELYVAAQKVPGSQDLITASMGKGATASGKALDKFLKLNPEMQKAGDIAYDAAGQMRSLPEIIDLVSRGTENMTQKQRNNYVTQIFGADATRSVLALMRAGRKDWDKMSAAVDRNGSAQALATAKMKGFKGSVEAFKSTLETLAITFGTVLLPAATSAMRFLTGSFAKLGEHKTATLALVGAVGALSAIVLTISAAVKVYTALTIAWGAATVATTAAVSAMGFALMALRAPLVTTALLMQAHPFVFIATAIIAVGAALVIAYKECETFRKIVDGAWKVIKRVAGWLITAGVKAFNAMRDAVKAAWRVIDTVTRAVWGGIKAYLGRAWHDIQDAAFDVWHAIDGIIVPIWRAIRDVTKAVWGFIKDKVLIPVWGAIKEVAKTHWDAIKTVVLTPMREARDVLKDHIWPAIKGVAKTAWGGLKTMFENGGQDILNVILWPFKQAVKQVAKFAKLILEVVDKIPGVNTEPAQASIDKFTQGLAKGGTFQAFARGGAFARTGGLVNAPITLMGEEAPKHPEFVIPTNPAYRTRARGLLAQAAGAIGFAKGGVMSQGAIEGLARSVYMSNPHLMSAIAMAESGGDPNIVGPPDGRGLWQIEWPVWGRTMASKGLTNAFNPLQNALMARHVLGAQGLGAWVAYTNGSYRNFMDGGQTPVVGNLVKALNPMDLIGKLPGVGDLPGWIQGLGKNVLGQVKDYITGALSFDAVGGKAGPGAGGLVTRAIQMAMAMGHPHPTDGQLTGGDHATGSLHYAGRAVDFGDAGQSAEKMLRLFSALYQEFGPKLNELFYDRSPWFIDNYQRQAGQFGGHIDHIHAGFARGGMYGLPYVGKYHGGGVAPREGLAHVSKGERMTPAGAATVLHAEIDLGEGIRQRVRLEFDAQGRQMRGAWNAGVAA
jgi:TP901 family phage tail tape measure protein